MTQKSYTLLNIIIVMMVGLSSKSFSQTDDIFQAIKDNDLPAVKGFVDEDLGNLEVIEEGLSSTPLLYAANEANLEIVQFLIEEGANIDALNSEGLNALSLVAMKDNLPIAKYLIENGINVDQKNEQKSMAASRVMYEGSDELISLIINKTTLDEETFLNLLAVAAAQQSTSTIDLLLDKNIEIPNTDNAINPLFSRSIRADHVRLLNLLLDKRPDFMKGHEDVWVSFAGEYGAVNVLKRFVELGNSLDITNRYGSSLIHLATKGNNLELIRFLVENGQDINARNGVGKSAFNIATDNNFQDLVAYLTKKGASDTPQEFPLVEGPYFGLEPPGDEPVEFANGILSIEGNEHSPPVFSNDGNEVFWASEFPMKLYTMVCEDGIWSAPKKSNINYRIINTEENPHYSSSEPVFSPDNKKLFFLSNRPIEGREKEDRDMYIWYVDRTEDGWSEAKFLEGGVNETPMYWTFSLNDENTICFSSKHRSVHGSKDIWESKLIEGVYQKPVNLGRTINSELLEHCPFIARDNSYMIYGIGNHPDNIGRFDLFISYREPNGDWTEGINLGPKINTKYGEAAPQVSPDGKYMFYQRYGEIFWVSASFVEELK
ncbi:MAG: ankyrin repeat domain-containing protein [Crocinitomicaceae bacterium]|nr:ankyrin repeat domain-containing protein [Crocinitomicaceae bacterium]